MAPFRGYGQSSKEDNPITPSGVNPDDLWSKHDPRYPHPPSLEEVKSREASRRLGSSSDTAHSGAWGAGPSASVPQTPVPLRSARSEAYQPSLAAGGPVDLTKILGFTATKSGTFSFGGLETNMGPTPSSNEITEPTGDDSTRMGKVTTSLKEFVHRWNREMIRQTQDEDKPDIATKNEPTRINAPTEPMKLIKVGNAAMSICPQDIGRYASNYPDFGIRKAGTWDSGFYSEDGGMEKKRSRSISRSDNDDSD